MNISNIDKYIKNINRVTYCLCIFILLRIILSNNINATGAKGAIFFAIVAPLLCWNYHKNFVNTYIGTIDEREENNMDKTNTNYNELTDIELQAQEIAEKYSITVEDAADMLNDATYDEVCEALDEAKLELQAQEIAEKYGISIDDANELLTDGTYDEVCEALDEVEAEEIAKKYSITVEDATNMLKDRTYDEVCQTLDKTINEFNSEETDFDEYVENESINPCDKNVKNEKLHSKVSYIRKSRELDI